MIAWAAAGQTLRNIDWFELVNVRGAILDCEVNNYQVSGHPEGRFATRGSQS